MNIILYKLYKIDQIKRPNIEIYITKNNKKPLHNKAYRQIWNFMEFKLCRCVCVCIYIEHCLCIQYNFTPVYAYSLKPIYIHISNINNKDLSKLTYDEIIKLQDMFLKSPYLVNKGVLNLLNMALYNE